MKKSVDAEKQDTNTCKYIFVHDIWLTATILLVSYIPICFPVGQLKITSDRPVSLLFSAYSFSIF